MKLIIAGSRTINLPPTQIEKIIEASLINSNEVSHIICGEAKGIDYSGKRYALVSNRSVVSFPADWDKFGNSAGPLRNKQMAEYADALLLIWDGESRGSKNMKDTMLKLGKPVYEVIIRKHNV